MSTEEEEVPQDIEGEEYVSISTTEDDIIAISMNGQEDCGYGLFVLEKPKDDN